MTQFQFLCGAGKVKGVVRGKTGRNFQDADSHGTSTCCSGKIQQDFSGKCFNFTFARDPAIIINPR